MCMYTQHCIFPSVFVFSWPITSLYPYQGDRRKSLIMVLYNSISFSRVGKTFWLQTLIGQFNSSELYSDFSLILRSWIWWRSTRYLAVLTFLPVVFIHNPRTISRVVCIKWATLHNLYLFLFLFDSSIYLLELLLNPVVSLFSCLEFTSSWLFGVKFLSSLLRPRQAKLQKTINYKQRPRFFYWIKINMYISNFTLLDNVLMLIS